MGHGVVDAESRPIATLLGRVVAAHPSSWVEKAELTGFSDRQLREWRRNQWCTMQLWTCDRILAALGNTDPTAYFLTSVGLQRHVGGGTHRFLSALIEQTLPAVIEAERAGVPIGHHHGIQAARILEDRLQKVAANQGIGREWGA